MPPLEAERRCVVKFFREAWGTMDTLDRVICITMSAAVLFAATALALFVAHGWINRAAVFAVGIGLGLWHWYQIPRDSLRQKLVSSICGDNSGPRSLFCNLEPGHPGDHRNFRSNGGCIGWPNKGGVS